MSSVGYGSPSQSYSSADMFAPASRSMDKNSNLLKAFGNTQTSRTGIEPEKSVSRGASLGINTNQSSFFDFDPPSNTGSPFQNHNQFGTPNGGAGGGISGWSSDLNFRPLSPPNSASPFSKDWNYGFQNMHPSSNILTDIQPNGTSNTRAQYGQVTPPDDDHGDESLLDYRLRDEQQQPQSDSPVHKKRKRGSGISSKENHTPAKRTCKYTSRNHASPSSNSNTDPNKPEDARRSKFLERNRVAASKCRQKKKEWTQNLEDRGRELQKNNNNLRLMVDSLRQEVLFLKGEMLKHNGCGCSQIHDFLKSGASALSANQQGEGDVLMKRENSPFESMPPSRIGSVGTEGMEAGSILDDEDVLGGGQHERQTNAEIAGDDSALEALLTSSINHDTSEEGIASQVGGA